MKYNELSDAQKSRARDKIRELNAQAQWWDEVYIDAITCAAILGITIGTASGCCINREGTWSKASIWFSGFSNQGDGACWEGDYHYVRHAAAEIRQHAPQDAVLHAIADDLTALQQKYDGKITADSTHRGHYYHSGCMDITAQIDGNLDDLDTDVTEEIAPILRRFADWIYRQLEVEDERRNSDEYVEEQIKSNDWDFDVGGNGIRI
jgi:hypothetical protein